MPEATSIRRDGDRNILIIQRVIPDYRKMFFKGLYSKLARDGISLSLLCGSPGREERLDDAAESLPFAIRTNHISFPGRAYWTARSWEMASHADLIILEQANAPLQNYAFMVRRRLQSLFWRKHHPLLAFWGVGTYFTHKNQHKLSELYKRVILQDVDWWFAYTTRTMQYVAAAGYPPDRITVVNNSTDVDALRKAISNVGEERADELFQSLFPGAVRSSCQVGIFCSRLLDRKGIPFLLRSSALIHQRLPTFRLVIIGDGPFRMLVEQFCRDNSWCVFLGRLSGLERAPYFKLADTWLCPGCIGLEAVDALAAGLPICGTFGEMLGPESACISNGNNGLMTEHDASQYANRIVSLLSSRSQLRTMKRRATRDSFEYGVQQMVDNFYYGVVQCLRIMGT
jgi:glycosyltransferase involved in cell wall biosynthesis